MKEEDLMKVVYEVVESACAASTTWERRIFIDMIHTHVMMATRIAFSLSLTGVPSQEERSTLEDWAETHGARLSAQVADMARLLLRRELLGEERRRGGGDDQQRPPPDNLYELLGQ